MSLALLERLVAAPEFPIDADMNKLAESENHLEIKFPSDYVSLCGLYGSGCFGDNTFYFDIENILRPNYAKIIDASLDFHRELHRDGPTYYTLEIFPEPNGYLP